MGGYRITRMLAFQNDRTLPAAIIFLVGPSCQSEIRIFIPEFLYAFEQRDILELRGIDRPGTVFVQDTRQRRAVDRRSGKRIMPSMDEDFILETAMPATGADPD